jgi:hypothetical protein
VAAVRDAVGAAHAGPPTCKATHRTRHEVASMYHGARQQAAAAPSVGSTELWTIDITHLQ